jgi:hypothetical protein
MDSFILLKSKMLVTRPPILQIKFPAMLRPAVWELDSREGELRILRAGPLQTAFANAGGLWRRSFDRHVAWRLPNPNANRTWQAFQVNLVTKRVQYAGFGWATGNGPGFEYAPIVTCSIPWWFPTGLCLVLPIVWTWKMPRGLMQYRQGLCEKYGYDLRATPNYCPECGHVSAKAKVAASVPD